ncbi:hypothetical protein BGZ97_006426, partial [Linnemannia gamsii]
AQDATYDLAIKAILAFGGVSEGKKFEGDGPAPIFAIGLGSFDTQTGLSSKHPQLEKRFIIKARAQSCTVVGVHEFNTSAKCPRPTCDTYLKSDKNRSRYCTSCRIFVDRDQGGSENIAHIALAHIKEQRRPAKFKPSAL